LYLQIYNAEANWTKSRLWSLKDECPLLNRTKLLKMFSDDSFFRNLTFKTGAFEVLSELAKDYPIIIVSIGTKENCSKKKDFIDANLPFVSKSILIAGKDENLIMDKSSVDMSDGIFIDDVEDNLFSSNAAMKILYENIPNAEWNHKWRGERINNWYDFYKYIV
jgi:5'(3')-deoxyribonucleotidase